jgi:hypothetical protein
LQLSNSTVAYVPVSLRVAKAALVVKGVATLRKPSVASMARAFDVAPASISKTLRKIGVPARAYRRKPKLPFPPSSSTPPVAPVSLSLTG